MKDITKRHILFLGGCIIIRLYLAYYVKNANKQQLKEISNLLLIPALGFLFIYLTGARKTGSETFGKPIWWNDLRPIHSLMYFTAAYMAYQSDNNAFKPLLIDVIIGLSAFLNYHGSCPFH